MIAELTLTIPIVIEVEVGRAVADFPEPPDGLSSEALWEWHRQHPGSFDRLIEDLRDYNQGRG